jgi:hypothetical protein
MTIDARVFMIIAVLILAIVGVIYLTMSRTMAPSLNRIKYQKKWLEIENSLVRDNLATYQVAIMNADKLVDLALRERKFKGATMGERMKSAQNQWKNPQHVWGAHKVRNQLAHESDYVLSRDIALRSLSAFKQALKDLGAF